MSGWQTRDPSQVGLDPANYSAALPFARLNAAGTAFEPVAAPEGGSGSFPILLVAADDASAAMKAAADYVCDGTDDHVEIELAVAALPTPGGTVLLSEGTFHVQPVTLCAPSGGPRVVGNVTLAGQGDATVLRLQDQAASNLPSNHGVIEAYGSSSTRVTGIHIRHLKIDGNRDNISGTLGLDMEGIELEYVDGFTVVDVTVVDPIESGVDLDHCSAGLVQGCRVRGSGGWGIHCSHGATDNRIIANDVLDCSVQFDRGGIDQWGGSPGGNRNIYIGNRVENSRRNYQIRGSQAVFIGNYSRGGSLADEFTANLLDLGTVAGLGLSAADLTSYPSASGQPAGKVAETNGADGWTFIDTPAAGGTVLAGNATIADAATTELVTHGGTVEPAAVLVTPRANEAVWVSTRGSTTFTVERAGSSGALTFDWLATGEVVPDAPGDLALDNLLNVAETLAGNPLTEPDAYPDATTGSLKAFAETLAGA